MLNGLLGFIYYVDFCTLLLVGNFINNAKSTNYKVSNFKWCWWLFTNNPFLWKHRSLLITILDFCMSIHDTSVCHHVMSSRSLISTEKHLGWPRKARSIYNSENSWPKGFLPSCLRTIRNTSHSIITALNGVWEKGEIQILKSLKNWQCATPWRQ